MNSLTPLHTLPGFVADETESTVAGHYGEPIAEQRAAVRGAALVDRSNRGVVTVSGVDRLTWLHSLTSQHLSGLADGQTTEALILSPHGHVEHDLELSEIDGVVWIDVEPDTVADLVAYLDSMRFMLRVEVTDRSAEFAVLTVVGPDAAAAIGQVSAAPSEPGTVAAGTGPIQGGYVRRNTWVGPPAYDLLVPREQLAALVHELRAHDVRPIGLLAFEAIRIEHMRPRLRRETDHRTIPHEVGWIGPAVHLDKGCYRGQETVARVHNLGRPPRRLVLLQLDGSLHLVPSSGDPVMSGGRQVGFVTTAALHHEDGPIALAIIKRAIADGTDLEVTNDEATIAAKVDHGLVV